MNIGLDTIYLEPSWVEFEMSRKELAEVLYPYRAINPDELSLVVGQTVVIMERNTIYPGWFLGELEGQQGFFPSYFIKIISSSLYTENSLQVRLENLNISSSSNFTFHYRIPNGILL